MAVVFAPSETLKTVAFYLLLFSTMFIASVHHMMIEVNYNENYWKDDEEWWDLVKDFKLKGGASFNFSLMPPYFLVSANILFLMGNAVRLMIMRVGTDIGKGMFLSLGIGVLVCFHYTTELLGTEEE